MLRISAVCILILQTFSLISLPWPFVIIFFIVCGVLNLIPV